MFRLATPQSLRGRFNLLFAAATLSGIGALSMGLGELNRLSGDATIVNLTGSLRMRAYLVASQTAAYAVAVEPASRVQLLSELDNYARILDVLDRGVYPAPKAVTAPAAREHLASLEMTFPAFRDSVIALMNDRDAGAPDALLDARLSTVTARAAALALDADALTNALARDSERNVARFRMLQVGAFALFVVLTILLVIGVDRYVLGPLPRMIAAFERFGDGDMAAAMPSGAHNEFRAIAQGWERMAARIRAQHDEIDQRDRALEEANAGLRRASQAKSQFVSNMSHELRTPLNAILGYTALALRGVYGEVPAKLVEPIRGVSESAKGLLVLVTNVLDIAKIEAGQTPIHIGPVAVAEILRGCIETVRPLAREKNLTLVDSVTNELPMIRTDAVKLREIVMNLLGNAIKFTNEGTVQVNAALVPGKRTLCVTVSDTGVGIPETEQARIFEAFHQADGSASRRVDGTGLGLTISRDFARLLAGDITVDSAPGKGSRFTLTLPDLPEPVSRKEADEHE
ncbi:MAG: ATP-binding protein [bacterium]